MGRFEFVKEKYNTTLSDADVATFYKFCKVHFKRSLSRILKNRKAVPFEKVEIFRTKIDNLFKFQPSQFSEFV